MMDAYPNEGWSDEELARRAARDREDPGGRQAAELLLGRYMRVVYRWCHHLVGDPELSRDLAQDILLRVYGNLDRFEGWGRFSAWLFVICRNRCLDALRRASPFIDEKDVIEKVADAGRPIDRELEEKEDEERLLLLVRRHLSPEEQEALWLRCIEGFPVDAITRALAVRQSTGARAVLQSARRKLRAALAASSGDRPPASPAGGGRGGEHVDA